MSDYIKLTMLETGRCCLVPIIQITAVYEEENAVFVELGIGYDGDWCGLYVKESLDSIGKILDARGVKYGKKK